MFRPTPPLPHSIPTYSALASPTHTLSSGGRVPARGLGAPASLDHDTKNNNNNNNNSITTKKKKPFPFYLFPGDEDCQIHTAEQLTG